MARLDKDTPDTRLLAAYRAGDLRAWDLLVERYEGLLLSVPRRMGLSRGDCEDVTQNVFISLLNHVDRLRDGERLRAWLLTTARREAWAFLRRARARAEALPDTEALERLPDTEDAALPEQAAVALEERHLVRQALATLPERCRTLLTRLYIDDPPLSYAEVAGALGVPVGSIGPTRARCLERLEKKVRELGF